MNLEEILDAVVGWKLRPEDPGRPVDASVLRVKIALSGSTPLKLGQRVEVQIATMGQSQAIKPAEDQGDPHLALYAGDRGPMRFPSEPYPLQQPRRGLEPRDIGRVAHPISEFASVADRDAGNTRGACRGQPGGGVLDGHDVGGADLESAQSQLVGLGIGLDRADVFLADDELKGLVKARRRQHGLDVLPPGSRDDGQPDPTAELFNQLDDARVKPGRITQHQDRQGLFFSDPSVDLTAHDSLSREQFAEELPVIHLGGTSRHFVGNLPAKGGEGPLPGGDMVILGVGYDSVEIEQDGTCGHGISRIGRGRDLEPNLDYGDRGPDRQILDKVRVTP